MNKQMTSMELLAGHLLPPFSNRTSSSSIPHLDSTPRSFPLSNLVVSLALTVSLSSPLPSFALPSINFPPLPLTTNPFSESKFLQTGLEDGKIRPCPSTNPGCVSTNARSSSYAFPWTIPDNSIGNAIQSLQESILNTQKNAKIQVVEDTPNGQYLQAEVDGGFGRDGLEFFVKGDAVTFRAMATKVTYIKFCLSGSVSSSIGIDPHEVFQDVEWALLIGAKPRGLGMLDEYG